MHLCYNPSYSLTEKLQGGKMAEKKCIKCDALLTSDNFTWYRAKNYIWKCNSCIKEEKRLHIAKKRAENPQHYDDLQNSYKVRLRQEDPVKYSCVQMRASSRKRAIALNKPHNITTDYLCSIAPKACPVFGHELKYGGGPKTKYSASLDRIDSSKGYTIGNVQIISQLANLMKNEASSDELVLFAKWVLAK